jgi:ABC-type transport system substrate-binding protein
VDFVSTSSTNWGKISDPQIDDLYERQARTLDKAERKKLVNEIEKIVLEKAHFVQGLWWVRSIVHWSKVKNWITPASHYSNQKLQDVWLSED